MEPHRPELIKGYEAPLSFAYSKDVRYKTFSEGKKTKKGEKFGSTSGAAQYAALVVPESDEENICPTCNKVAITFSNCVYNVRGCGSHSWFTSRDGEKKIGDPRKR